MFGSAARGACACAWFLSLARVRTLRNSIGSSVSPIRTDSTSDTCFTFSCAIPLTLYNGTLCAALTISYDWVPYEEMHTPVLQAFGVMLVELSLSPFGMIFFDTPRGFTRDLDRLCLSCPNLRRLAIRGLHVPDGYFRTLPPSITTIELDWAYPDDNHELGGAPFSALLAHMSTAILQRIVVRRSDDILIEIWQWWPVDVYSKTMQKCFAEATKLDSLCSTKGTSTYARIFRRHGQKPCRRV